MIFVPESWHSFSFLFFTSHEEERYNQINSFLEGLFDSSEQLLVPNCPKPELFESFHFFDDVFPNESRMISVFDHQKPKEDMQACKSLTTCKVGKSI